MIREFVEAVVNTRDFNLEVVEGLEEPGRLSKLTPAGYDAVLLFDGRTGGVAKVAADTGIPKEKLHQLW